MMGEVQAQLAKQTVGASAPQAMGTSWSPTGGLAQAGLSQGPQRLTAELQLPLNPLLQGSLLLWRDSTGSLW